MVLKGSLETSVPRYSTVVLRSLIALGALLLLSNPALAQSVPTYHGSSARGGNYVMPGLTWKRASHLHRDAAFDGKIDGQVYAQPLFWSSPQTGRRLVIAATESDVVYALDARTGKVVWRKAAGLPVPLSALPCGGIDPLGITGTPVIDKTRAAVYFDAMVQGGKLGEPRHLVFGLSLKDGAPLTGFPVDVGKALQASGISFTPRIQNQRGALLIAADTLFIPYGGHLGDCGPYHGWVVGIRLGNPSKVFAWSTRAEGGGIWAPGGIADDGQSLFFATGNTKGAQQWSDGDAVFRLGTGLARSSNPRDFFAPADWKRLDETDEDLGGTNPIPIDVSDSKGGGHFVLALGKDGKAYLLSRENLGGLGGALAVKRVSSVPIRTAPAAFAVPGAAFVALQGRGIGCPNRLSNPGLIVLRIKAHPSPAISTAWCASFEGRGAPVITTSDGLSNPIVWVVGAEGDERLHGFRGDDGTPILAGGNAEDRTPNVAHFSTILAADGRLFVAGDGEIYAFTP